jgi:hypothetical protein
MLIADQSSLNRAMADPAYEFKSNHFLFKTDTAFDLSTKRRFLSMLKNDPAHMMPGEKGQPVTCVQHALVKIYELGPIEQAATFKNFGIFGDDNEVASREYGPHSQAYIFLLKETFRIVNYMNKIDPIVGKKTIRALDYILWRNAK